MNYQLKVTVLTFVKKIFFEEKSVDFFAYVTTRGYPSVPSTNFSPFGPAVWPAISKIQTNIYGRRELL